MKPLAVSFLLLTLSSMSLAAVPDPHRSIAQAHGVSAEVIYAISQTESAPAGSNRPWPWAVNVAGKGYWFRSRDAAAQYLQQLINAGHCRFDVGYMQVHWCVHAHRVGADVQRLLDPTTNIAIGSQIFAELLTQYGNYGEAIAAYHAGTGRSSKVRHRGYRYAQKVVKKLRALL